MTALQFKNPNFRKPGGWLDEARSSRPSFLSFIRLNLGKALPSLSDYSDELLVTESLDWPLCRSVLMSLWQERHYQPHILNRMFLPNLLKHLCRMRLAISSD